MKTEFFMMQTDIILVSSVSHIKDPVFSFSLHYFHISLSHKDMIIET